MGIKYISKNKDGNWKISTTKSGKSVKNFNTEKQAIKFAQGLKSTEAILIKKNNDWNKYDDTNSSASSQKKKTPPKKATKTSAVPTKKTKASGDQKKTKTSTVVKSDKTKSSSAKKKVTKTTGATNKKTTTKSSNQKKTVTKKAPVQKGPAQVNILTQRESDKSFARKDVFENDVPVLEEALDQALKDVAPKIIEALKKSDVELTAEQKLATQMSKQQPSDLVKEKNIMSIVLSIFVIIITIGLIVTISLII